MNREVATEYFKNLGQELRSFSSRQDRAEWLSLSRDGNTYRDAFTSLRGVKPQAKPIPFRSKPTLILGIDPSTYRLVGEEKTDNSQPSVESPLTKEQQTVVWANRAFDDYQNMPKGNRAERKRVEGLIKRISRDLIEDPTTMGIAGGVWRVNFEHESGKPNSEAQTFYRDVRDTLRQEAKDGWDKISSNKLKTVITTYVHSPLAQDLADSVLTGYFRGPSSVNQSVECVYRLAEAALDSFNDPKALELAVRIGLYDTSFVPATSQLREHTYQARFLTIDDDVLLGKASQADSILWNLAYLTTVNFEEVRSKRHQEFSDSSSAEKLKRLQLRIKKRGEWASRRMELLADASTTATIATTAEHKAELMSKWPMSILLSQEDPLRKKYDSLVASRVSSETFRAVTLPRWLRARGITEDVVRVGIGAVDGIVTDVYPPQRLSSRRNEIIRLALQTGLDAGRRDLLLNSVEQGQINLQEITFEGNPISVVHRKEAAYDTLRHPLEDLNSIGFPTPELSEGQKFSIVNDELADFIFRRRARYLNKRGVRVPVANSELSALGYSAFEFRQDGTDPKAVQVDIAVGRHKVGIKMDEYFNLDLEGKNIDSPELQESVRFVLLSMLRPILCESGVKGESGEAIDEEGLEVVSRMGHYRFLPVVVDPETGATRFYTFSGEATEQYRKDTGGVLAITNVARKIEFGTDKNTTWVKEVKETTEGLPPVVLNLPGVVRFKSF